MEMEVAVEEVYAAAEERGVVVVSWAGVAARVCFEEARRRASSRASVDDIVKTHVELEKNVEVSRVFTVEGAHEETR